MRTDSIIAIVTAIALAGCGPTSGVGPDTGPGEDAPGADASAGGPDAGAPDPDGGAAPDAFTIADAGPPPVEETVWPDPEWATADPAEHGLDPAGLQDAADYARSIGSLCLLVIRDGHLVFERYWGDARATTPNRSWSIAKSYTAALIGAALLRGEIESLDQPVADFVGEWRETDREAITIRDLLTMTSGLRFDFVSDYTWTLFSRDMTREAVGLPVSDAPGAAWHYNNHAVQVLEAVLHSATGRDLEDYAREALWEPLGMHTGGAEDERVSWERDPAGNVTTFMNVRASCRDMSRFGYLLLNGGRWRDERLLGAEYVAAATAPSQPLNRGYGYLIWTNGGTPAFDAAGNELEGGILPSSPPDTFSLQGFGQSFVDVVPSTRTIYVHMRHAPHDPPTRFITDLPGTVDALLRDAGREEHRRLNELLIDAS